MCVLAWRDHGRLSRIGTTKVETRNRKDGAAGLGAIGWREISHVGRAYSHEEN